MIIGDPNNNKNLINLNSDDTNAYLDIPYDKNQNAVEYYTTVKDYNENISESNTMRIDEISNINNDKINNINNNNLYISENVIENTNTLNDNAQICRNKINNEYVRNINNSKEHQVSSVNINSVQNDFLNNNINDKTNLHDNIELKEKSPVNVNISNINETNMKYASNNTHLHSPMDKYNNDNYNENANNNIHLSNKNNDILNNVDNLHFSNEDKTNTDIQKDTLSSNNVLLNTNSLQTNKEKKKKLNQKNKIIKRCAGVPDKEEPILPFYVICDYVDFIERKLYVNRFRFKLYDPIYQLGKYRNCAGVILKKNIKKSCLNYIDSNFLFLKKELCKIDLDIDIRCPTKQIFKHVCYKMNVDPTHVLIFPYPPLNSPVNFSPYNIDSFTCHSDSDYENYQRNNNSSYGQTPFETLLKQHSMALEHNSLTEQKTFCLSLLPFHYKYFSRLYPSQCPKYFHYVVQLFNKHVQSVAAFSGHIKFKRNMEGDNKSDDFYDIEESNNEYTSSNSDNSNSTIVNNEYIPNNYTTVQDLIDKIKLEINPYLKKRGIDVKQKFRLLFTFGPKIKYLNNDEQLIEMDFVKTHHIKNIYVTPLRMEPDFTDEEKRLIENDKLKIIHVFNQTPSKEVFGYSFDVLVEPNDNMLDIKNKIRKRTLLPKYIFDKITFFEFENGQRIWRSNDDTINWKNKQFAIIIGEHHAPSHSKPQMGMKIA